MTSLSFDTETTAIIIRNDALRTIEFPPAAMELKDAALSMGALIGRVSTPDENQAAVEAQQALKGFLDTCEKARKVCKEPVLKFSRAIDGSVKTFIEEVQLEFMRVSKLVGDFQALELAKQRAADNERRLEDEKLQREREQEERRIREEARAAERKLDEAEEAAVRAQMEARNEKERAEAAVRQHEIDRQRALAAAQTHEQLEAVQERTNNAAAALPTVTAVKADGQSVREEPVIDQIREFELMKARPDLVRKVEFDLVAIKSELTRGLKLPGVTSHMEIKATVVGRRAAVINV